MKIGSSSPISNSQPSKSKENLLDVLVTAPTLSANL